MSWPCDCRLFKEKSHHLASTKEERSVENCYDIIITIIYLKKYSTSSLFFFHTDSFIQSRVMGDSEVMSLARMNNYGAQNPHYYKASDSAVDSLDLPLCFCG